MMADDSNVDKQHRQKDDEENKNKTYQTSLQSDSADLVSNREIHMTSVTANTNESVHSPQSSEVVDHKNDLQDTDSVYENNQQSDIIGLFSKRSEGAENKNQDYEQNKAVEMKQTGQEHIVSLEGNEDFNLSAMQNIDNDYDNNEEEHDVGKYDEEEFRETNYEEENSNFNEDDDIEKSGITGVCLHRGPQEANYLTENSQVILNPLRLNSTSSARRRLTPTVNQASLEDGRQSSEDTEHELRTKPHFERRKIYNIVKHVISIVLIILDIIFDWVQYSEMNTRGNYSIVAERRLKNIEFTFECEGTGKEVQFVFMIFTIIATILSIVQVVNIIYQMHFEFKGVFIDKKLFHEYVETFVFLFFIEISQILLIMGFYDVCSLDCIINGTEIIIAMNGIISFTKITWRFSTSWRCCTVYWKIPNRPQTTRRTPITRPRSQVRVPYTDEPCSGCGSGCQTCLLVLLCLLFPPVIICILVYNCCAKDSQVEDRRERSKWKCEKQCKCCILRCFPSRFEDPETQACDCTCKQCLSCEKSCKCCILRCFPSYLDPSADDAFECTCGKCMRCEKICGCCILRCFPSQLPSPHSDFCTCRCGDCMAREFPCICFTFRCFPKHLNPPERDIWTCRCAECLSCELPCKCCVCRCFPEYISKDNWFDCTLGECMKCEQMCCCCILRCFPSYMGEDEYCTCIFKECTSCEKSFGCCTSRCFPSALVPPKDEIFECTCGDCLACQKDLVCCKVRCCPTHLKPSSENWCECTCCKTRVSPTPVPPPQITMQRIPPPQPVIQQPLPSPPIHILIERPRLPTPPPRSPKEPVCRKCCVKFKYFLVALLLLFIFCLLIVYFYLEVVQIRYVLVCVVNDTLMNTTQHYLVQNYLELFRL